MINNTLREFLDITVITYVDNILIYTKKSLQKHIKDIQAVFNKLSQTTFKIAPEKCEFYKKSIKFLGFIISIDGVKIDPGKTESIREQLTPKTVKDI